MRLGVHVSIEGKIYKALDKARSLNCDTMQIFSRNPRGWKVKNINPEETKIFIKRRKTYGIWPLVVHIPYLINLASPYRGLYHRSIKAFIRDVKTAELLKAEYCVTHIGSHKGKGRAFGLKRFYKGLTEVLERTRPALTILLETTAGSGFGIGDRFEDLRYILSHLKEQDKVGICLDTSHVFAAGYDISTKKGLRETIGEFDKIVGLQRLKLIHLNDSKAPLNSHVDRHQHIGKGKIGLEGFRQIVNHPYLSKIPMLLETPKKSPRDDINNLRVVRNLCRNHIHLTKSSRNGRGTGSRIDFLKSI